MIPFHHLDHLYIVSASSYITTFFNHNTSGTLMHLCVLEIDGETVITSDSTMDSSPTNSINANRVHKRSMKKMSSSGGSGSGSGSGSGGSFSSGAGLSVRRRRPSLDGHHEEEYMKSEQLHQEDKMEAQEPVYPTYTPRRRLSYTPRVTLPPSPQSPAPVELPYGKITFQTSKSDHTDRIFP
jgi:hypothetical protein